MASGPIPRPDRQGWFPDPSGRHELRWFNGAKWTTAVMDDGIESRHDPREPDPLAVELEVPPADEDSDPDAGAWETAALPTTSSPRGRRSPSSSWWSQRSAGAKGALVVGVILVVLLAFGALARDRDSSNDSPAAATTSTRERVGTTQVATTESATTAPPTPTLPPPKTAAPPPPTPAPPPPTPAAPQVPAPVPSAAPPAPPSCNPNYSGCVQVASDVDCAGGSGDGPAYVNGPVQIVGSDVYDLDSDNDGVGCE